MHLLMLLGSLGLAVGLRFVWFEPTRLKGTATTWEQRWQRALGIFLFPPLLLLMTAIALFLMGHQGRMLHWQEGWSIYSLAIGFLVFAAFLALKLTLQGWQSLRQIHTYPQLEINGKPGRLLDSPIPFIAQVGFWRSELVVSQGLLDTFAPQYLEAVLAHEQAHNYYRDTFWFMGLGWLRRLTSWLPQTEALWQELLVLRELRADGWAAQQVDNLLLAEALLSVASAPLLTSEFCAPFSSAVTPDRLTQRIEALLTDSELPAQPTISYWCWFCLAGLPLIAIPFHT